MRGSLRLPNGLRAARASLRSTSIFPPRLAASTNPLSQTAINARNHTLNPSYKSFHTTPSLSKNRDRDAIPDNSHRTSFSELDVLGSVPVPSTSVDVCMHDGFGLNSGITIAGGDGALLVNGEAFAWRPWEVSGKMKLVNEKGQFEVPAEAFGLFDVLWPRPGMFLLSFFLWQDTVCVCVSLGRNRRSYTCVCRLS